MTTQLLQIPRVGTTIHVTTDGLYMGIIRGSKAERCFIEPEYTLQIIENGEIGPHLMIMDGCYLGRPVSQFNDRLVLGITYKEFVDMKKAGILR